MTLMAWHIEVMDLVGKCGLFDVAGQQSNSAAMQYDRNPAGQYLMGRNPTNQQFTE